MLYRYSAADKNGKIIEGDFEADNLQQVLQHLAGRELRPLSVKPLKERVSFHLFARGITIADKIFLTKYLSLMLKVGTDLLSAIDILIADFDKPAMRNFLLEVRENLTRGRQFYEAFSRYPRVFSLVFVNLIKAAESSGNLQETFESLSVSVQKDAELRNRIRSALIYPIILLSISVVIVVFLSTFALPKIANAFLQSGIKPPFFSRIVFAVGLFIGQNVALLLSALIIIVGGSLLFFWRTDLGRHWLDKTLSSLPLINKIYRDLAVQRFASTFSSLMAAGLPIIETTNITAQVVGMEEFRLALSRIAQEGLAKGITIGEAFRRETVFPKVVVNLISISEKAGHLEEVLGTLADFYESNIDANVRSLVSVLEPILLLTMGVLVGGIALSIIVPIYQLTSQF